MSRPHPTDHEAAGASCDASGQEALHLYVDGELPIGEQAALFEHLSACAACRRMLESVLAFRRASRKERVAVSPAADDAFFQRLAGHKARRPARPKARATRPPRRHWAAPVALAVALLLIVAAQLWPASPPADAVPLVTGEEERVELPALDAADRQAIYVFYPGLTVEAPRAQEPLGPEAL